MDVEKRLEKPLRSCPVNFAKPMSLVMDDRLSQPHLHSSAKRVSTKSKAPSPPGLKNLDSSDFSQWYPGNAPFTMDHKEKLVDKDLSLVVVLPDGVEKMTTVHGSKPLMDLLVTLCARYHLNPSSYTLELITAGRHNVKLKPSALIGTLHAEKILLKPKGDDKNKKTGPQKPEATVRMVINYKKTQKAILRVNPQIPLTELLPAICEKCEFAEETTILLRDVQSLAPLDLSCSLNDYAIREVYARDTRGHVDSPACPASPTHAVAVTPGKDKNQKETENKGLFSKFRKSKKTSEQATTVSAPASPVLVSKPRPLSMALPGSSSPPLMSPTSPVGDAPKKRRAPPPPIVVSQSCHADLGARQRFYSEPTTTSGDCEVSGLSCGSSAESSLKRTKRKAPQPPTSPSGAAPETISPQENMQDSVGAKTLEEIMEETSAAASEIQREDASVGSISDKGCGVDPSRDLSSHGNLSQSTTSDSAIQTVEKMPAGPDSSQLAASVSRQVESELEAPASQREKVDSGSVTSELEACQKNEDRCLPASVREHISAAEEESHVLSASHPAGDDAQVQTHFPPLPEPPRQQQERTDQAPPSAKEPGFESSDGDKKNIATSAGEPLRGDLGCAQAPETCQTPTPPVSPKAAPDAASHPELKPKPSNELTRDYIPKVGMTTYTVVPPKSNEKLRYFEVALTLETAPVAAEDVSERSNAPRDRILSSTTTTTTTTSALNTVNGCLAEATHASSPSSSPKADDTLRSAQAGSPGEVKATKIPPATKPKPGSFRLSKHKKTPGYYVTSAAEKRPGAISSPGHMGDQVDRALSPPLLPPPPPPPPPVQGDTEATAIQATRVTRQSSLPAKEPSFGLSLEKLKSFAAPRPYSPSTPSRFAQAVSSAVKRSHSLSLRPRTDGSPVAPSCPAANRYSVIERNAGKEFKVDEVMSEKGVEGQLTSPSELLRTDGTTESPIAVPYDKI